MSDVDVRHGDLVAVASEINKEHRLCEEAAGKAVSHAIRCGELLTAAKSKIPHGHWGAWLSENFEGSVRTAQVYMRLANNREAIEAVKTQSSAHLSIDGALKSLSTVKKPSEPTERWSTLKARETTIQDARAATLGIAEDLTALYRGHGYKHLGYDSFADFVSGELATQGAPFPIPSEVVCDDAGKPIPVFAMAENIYAWGIARIMELDVGA